jgi:putative transposase
MARAKRHYLPGYIWHITHRCHKREFLLRFSKDRHRYLQWLYQARKRYGLSLLNYMVTSNHIHLLVADTGDRDVIPNSMQLVAGRTGQEYNQRKDRKEAYWEDRYHATALSPSTRNEASAGIRGKRSENGGDPPGLCKSVGMRHDVAYLSLLR